MTIKFSLSIDSYKRDSECTGVSGRALGEIRYYIAPPGPASRRTTVDSSRTSRPAGLPGCRYGNETPRAVTADTFVGRVPAETSGRYFPAAIRVLLVITAAAAAAGTRARHLAPTRSHSGRPAIIGIKYKVKLPFDGFVFEDTAETVIR